MAHSSLISGVTRRFRLKNEVEIEEQFRFVDVQPLCGPLVPLRPSIVTPHCTHQRFIDHFAGILPQRRKSRPRGNLVKIIQTDAGVPAMLALRQTRGGE